MYTGRTNFDIKGQLQNQRYFHGVCLLYCYNTNCEKTMVSDVAILAYM